MADDQRTGTHKIGRDDIYHLRVRTILYKINETGRMAGLKHFGIAKEGLKRETEQTLEQTDLKTSDAINYM